MPAAISAASVVAIGKFDPDLFRLESLKEFQAISATEANKTKVIALLPNRVVHLTLPWGELLVLPDRLQVIATEAPYIRVPDLVGQAMNMVGDRCSFRALGINFEAHFDMGSISNRDGLATKLAPAVAWGEWGAAIRTSMQGENQELHGGLAGLTMRERFRDGDIFGWYDVMLTTSERLPQTGVQFTTNHHHEYAPEQPSAVEVSPEWLTEKRTVELLKVLAVEFDNSINKAERIFSEVMA